MRVEVAVPVRAAHSVELRDLKPRGHWEAQRCGEGREWGRRGGGCGHDLGRHARLCARHTGRAAPCPSCPPPEAAPGVGKEMAAPAGPVHAGPGAQPSPAGWRGR